jgi:hypothetical protein
MHRGKARRGEESAAGREFVWPPPSDELEAIEILPLGGAQPREPRVPRVADPDGSPAEPMPLGAPSGPFQRLDLPPQEVVRSAAEPLPRSALDERAFSWPPRPQDVNAIEVRDLERIVDARPFRRSPLARLGFLAAGVICAAALGFLIEGVAHRLQQDPGEPLAAPPQSTRAEALRDSTSASALPPDDRMWPAVLPGVAPARPAPSDAVATSAPTDRAEPPGTPPRRSGTAGTADESSEAPQPPAPAAGPGPRRDAPAPGAIEARGASAGGGSEAGARASRLVEPAPSRREPEAGLPPRTVPTVAARAVPEPPAALRDSSEPSSFRGSSAPSAEVVESLARPLPPAALGASASAPPPGSAVNEATPGGAAATTASSAAAPVSSGRLEEQGIRATLGAYQSAYERLDAAAAKAVWPAVDQRALARAFDGLRSQGLVFDDCQMQVQAQQATATCRGRATFVPRVGSSEARTERRLWTFQLQKAGESWIIRSAEAR